MEIKIGRVVRSIAGRDKGRLLVITGIENENLYFCDGKERPLERPKRKLLKHVVLTEHILKAEQMTTNRQLRRSLNDL